MRKRYRKSAKKEKVKGTDQMNHQYNLQFEKLCDTLKLGEIIKTPEIISGGQVSWKMEP
ncbi:hypothetical protein [Paenibacillus macquariensis]|uniref:Uncharacterized protein n=1 Tax=Paenibacillus macquariensis TaxID=948756 RepID=A0ABY1KHB5_9BACL|nr:hypothetical protein [Paenibacillus macquariensis]MEC0093153.1 hypothetical protein [Paenibacillus macquariensis]SIR68461.1 hypothetical protein SAMN05421578_1336 [Paenibacillus macquariensis]